MKHLKKFQTNSDYQTFKGSSDWITPNISVIVEDDTIMFEPFTDVVSLITFTINRVEYRAEEGMTFYDWAMSEYYDDLCRLTISGAYDLKDDIINLNINPGMQYQIVYGSGFLIIPSIHTDTIIQPISYIADTSSVGGQ